MHVLDPNRGGILVTGSSGCLGNALAHRLAERGRRVVGLDIRPPDHAQGFATVVGSVCDVELIHRVLAAHRVDAVVHCGGLSGAAVAPSQPQLHCETNIFGTVHLLEAARMHGVRRFVYCSSTGAYGDTQGAAVSEAAAFQPNSVYGATKAACDGLVRAYRLQHGVDGVCLRIGRVYGPGRRAGSIVRDMLQASLAGEPLRLPGSGGKRLQYVYVDDVVAALLRAVELAQLPLPAYNISGPGSHCDEEVAAVVRALLPRARIEFEGAAQAPGSSYGPLLDCAAAARDLDHRPRSLRAGVADFLRWMRADVPPHVRPSRTAA